jgi:nitroreductase
VVVITDRDTRRQLRELYEPAWVEYTKQMGVRAMLDAGERPESVPAGRWRMLKGADEFAHTFDEVPVHLIPCVDIDALAIVDVSLERPSIVGGASVYPFVQNVLLGLRAEGLGSAFTTLLTPAEPQVQELLGIPDGVAVAGHISVGHRADPWPAKLSRKPVSEFAFAERYGDAW